MTSTPTLCACGCGRDTKGHGRFLNGRHREQLEASQTYPRPIMPGVRLNRCEKHGREFREYTPLAPIPGSIFAGVVTFWQGQCPDCAVEERERIEANNRPKPVSQEQRDADNMFARMYGPDLGVGR